MNCCNKCHCEPCHCKERECEAEFRHHLRTTLLLLGAPKEVYDILEQTNDRPTNGQDLHTVMCYNIDLVGSMKSRLMSLPTIKIKPEPEEPPPYSDYDAD